MPAYNAECFLEECVSSFRLAANPDVEVIVVDDVVGVNEPDPITFSAQTTGIAC